MNLIVLNSLLSLGLAVGMLIMMAIGRWNGARRIASDPEQYAAGTAAIEGSIYALLGLVLAFSFNGAGQRFFERRTLVGHEINVIGTAYLRIDALPVDAQPEIRGLFRRYLDLRIAAIRALPDARRSIQHFDEASRALQEIWDLAIAATDGGTRQPATMLVLPALNEMIDMQTTARVVMLQHPHPIIFVVLAAFMLLAALLAGQAMARMRSPSLLHAGGLVVLLAGMFFIIQDMEYPQHGLIRIDGVQRLVEDLRHSIGE